jgi:hypothetical protein
VSGRALGSYFQVVLVLARKARPIFVALLARKFLRRGDEGYGELFPDEELPVVIPTLVLSFQLSMQLHVKQWTETQNEKYLASFMTHHLLLRKKRACHPQASASLSAFSWKKLLSALTDWVLDLRLWRKCRIASIPFVHIVLPLIYPHLSLVLIQEVLDSCISLLHVSGFFLTKNYRLSTFA